MSHNTLENYYKSIFNLAHLHRFGSINEIEQLIPFERDIYVSLIREEMQKQEEALKQAQWAESKGMR